MECFIVRGEDIDPDQHTLSLVGDEAHHALRALRIQLGEELLATDLLGTCYRCRVEQANSATLDCIIEEILPNFGEPARDVLLIQALIAQPSRWEFLIEKATELGVTSIQPVTTERTEREHFNRERSERILRAAVKQTKRARMPQLLDVAALSNVLFTSVGSGRKMMLLHEGADDSSARLKTPSDNAPIAIAVGPEGGFSDNEVRIASEAGAEIISLGPRRLRAETAAIAALAVVTISKDLP